VDSVVCDPPYELGFMGRAWDASGIAYSVDLWREVYRVLKPGGHLVAFGGTRTSHRMTCAIEDAGFEIRDSLHWLYGSGFPKSHDVSKALDKAAGAERAVTGPKVYGDGHIQNNGGNHNRNAYGNYTGDNVPLTIMDTAPATDLAAQWAGWGTALKPAHEPIVLARKPLAGTVAATVAAWGTGGINIDACRVATTDDLNGGGYSGGDPTGMFGLKHLQPEQYEQPAGRWPPNVLLTHSAACQPMGTRQVRGDTRATTGGKQQVQAPGQHGIYNTFNGIERGTPAYGTPEGTETVPAYACAPDCPVAALDRQSGERRSAYPGNQPAADAYTGTAVDTSRSVTYGTVGKHAGQAYSDTGGASRFFPVLTWDPAYDVPFAYVPKASRAERTSNGTVVNTHSTVKPVKLMEWLCQLVTPPGGTILDPFLGSGTTGVAAIRLGYNFIGCEQDESYLNIARSRINHAIQLSEQGARQATFASELSDRPDLLHLPLTPLVNDRTGTE
jgi:site-specific DNA-methyltransferase (adenine-specific)